MGTTNLDRLNLWQRTRHSRPSRELVRLGIDLHLFAHLNVERSFDLQAGLEAGELGDVSAGVAARTSFQQKAYASRSTPGS